MLVLEKWSPEEMPVLDLRPEAAYLKNRLLGSYNIPLVSTSIAHGQEVSCSWIHQADTVAPCSHAVSHDNTVPPFAPG